MHFVDTDILLYAVSASSEDAAKRSRALALLEEGDYQATRHNRPGAPTSGQALRFLEAIYSFPIQSTTPKYS